MRKTVGLLAMSALPVLLAFGSASAAHGGVILDTKSFWRSRTVWETPEVITSAGETHHARVNVQTHLGYYLTKKVPMVRVPAENPADWMKADFDDSSWARLRGPMLAKSNNECWKLILMRGRFGVADPARVKDLTLSLNFRGGAVVYLNGRELKRAHMPEGKLGLYTLAKPYPKDLYFDAQGFVALHPNADKRTRRVTGLTIPTSSLRKGVNVLAVAICRAPTPTTFYTKKPRKRPRINSSYFWAKIGLLSVRLSAPAGSGVAAGNGSLRGRGFKVWNQSIVQAINLADGADPYAPLRPLRLTGVRNGTFAGQVVVGDAKPIKGLKVQVSDLKGPGTIPAAAVGVRYAQADGASGRRRPKFFDSLATNPPAEVPVYKANSSAVQPIWITVNVPADAKAGEYSGKVTINASGVASVGVPVKLKVFDWTLPAVKKYTARMDLIQSPETVALAYGVKLWSDEHFKLLDKTFALLAPLANKTVFITCVRRTHLGNEHAMVRWYRNGKGELTPDFSIAEKYLDVAVKHLGKIPGVVLYCWEPLESAGHAGGAGTATRTYDKPILITTVNRKTGAMRARRGPAWGSEESKKFWKKLTDGIKPVLKKRGLEKSVLFGLVGDARPTKRAMDDITNGVPGAKWAVHSHFYCAKWQGYDIGMCVALWGIGVGPTDPVKGYSFGWSNPKWLSYFPREMKLNSTLVEHRVKLEKWMGAKKFYSPFVSTGLGPRGLGRIGADFWPVLKDKRGRVRGSLAGRYPESYWGQLNLNYCVPYVLARGKRGPLATVRSEAFRESLQEVETRIYVEKALLDGEAKKLLGDELMKRCRAALDERIRICMYADGEGVPLFISSDWGKRSQVLFGLAAEVAAKFGGRAPRPHLKRNSKKKR